MVKDKKRKTLGLQFANVKTYSNHLMLFICVPAGTFERFYLMPYETYLTNSIENSQRWCCMPLLEYKDPGNIDGK